MRGMKNGEILLRYPGYYKTFCCSGSQCIDTCCAGWQISVDSETLRTYLAMPGKMGARLRDSLDGKTGRFHMQEGRCPFLNENNLCDLILERGNEALCRTCRRYPRHVEVYGPLRERSLSLSCPEAAKLILCGEERERMFLKKSFVNRAVWKNSADHGRKRKRLSRLFFVRKSMLEILSDRKVSIEHRMALILVLGHDAQKQMDRERRGESGGKRGGKRGRKNGRSDALTAITNRYRAGKNPDLSECLRPYTGQKEKRRNLMCLYLELAGRLEPVAPGWRKWMDDTARRLYGIGTDERSYGELEAGIKKEYRNWEFNLEHLLNYFLRGYVLGAYYDGELEAKVKMAVAGCLVIRELGMGIYAEKGFFGRGEELLAAYRFSRELEHSDYNLNKWERIASRHPAMGTRQLLIGILS